MSNEQINKENEVLEALMKKALDNSAQAFSVMIKKKIDHHFHIQRFSANEELEDILSVYHDGQYTVLETKVLGDLKGVCYLMMEKTTSSQIAELTIPEFLKGKADASMADAMLLELDNVLSAATITVFSNQTKKATYGGVPGMKTMDLKSLDALLHKEYGVYGKGESGSKGLMVYAEYSVEGVVGLPGYVWIFNGDFCDVAVSQSLMLSQK
jgi:chemotaxis protein CheY-P-specific phosphatase CheC